MWKCDKKSLMTNNKDLIEFYDRVSSARWYSYIFPTLFYCFTVFSSWTIPLALLEES